jgi:hypothetical protein
MMGGPAVGFGTSVRHGLETVVRFITGQNEENLNGQSDFLVSHFKRRILITGQNKENLNQIFTFTLNASRETT